MNKKVLRGGTILLSSSLVGTLLPSGASNAFPWMETLAYAYYFISVHQLLQYFRSCCSRRRPNRYSSLRLAKAIDEKFEGVKNTDVTENIRLKSAKPLVEKVEEVKNTNITDKVWLRSVEAPSEKVKEVKGLLDDCVASLKDIVPYFEDFFVLSYDEKRNIYSGKLEFLGEKMFDVKLSSVNVKCSEVLEYRFILEIGENFKVEVYGLPETFLVDLCATLKSIEALVKTEKFNWLVTHYKDGSGKRFVTIDLRPTDGLTINSDGRTIKKISLVLTDDAFGQEGICFFGSLNSLLIDEPLLVSSIDPFRGGIRRYVNFLNKINNGIENLGKATEVNLEGMFDS